MSDPSHPNAVGVVAVSSAAYVRRVLELLAEGRVVVSLRDAADDERLRSTGVRQVDVPVSDFGWLQPHHVPSRSQETAQISFTSGTEGVPKAVELSHEALADVVERLNDLMGVDETIREYVGVPVYHSFGFGRCRAVGAVGGRFYIPENGFNPIEVADMLRKQEINAISAVPSLWRTVLDDPTPFAGIGKGIRWIEIGSQYMSRAEKEALRDLFPKAKLVQHYGLTEASRTTFLEIDAVEGAALESVGKAFGKVEVEISPAGLIRIRGPHVTRRIWIRGEPQQPTVDGWYETQDRGRLEGGFLYYEGRADDLINCGGLKLSPELLESRMRDAVGSRDFAVSRVPDRVRGDGILLAWTPSSRDAKDALLNSLIEEAARLGVNARGAIRGVEVEALPRTPAGKVQRRVLADEHADAELLRERRAPERSEPEGSGGAPTTDAERELAAIWQEVLGIESIRVDESFYDLGGDSVTALRAVVRMSRLGLDMGTCRRIFQGATIRDIASVRETGSRVVNDKPLALDYLTTLSVNALRGLLVATVVVGHWSGGFIGRLPVDADWMWPVVSPFFSFGTPGFAIVFGIGFGYLYLRHMGTAPARVAQAMRLGTAIVGAGVLAFGVFRILVSQREITQANFFEHFYSALTFYLLALPTMPIWGWLANRVRDRWRVPLLLGCAVTTYIIALGLQALWADARPDGFMRLVRLMLVAKYSYFEMISGVLLGVAVGTALRRHEADEQLPRKFLVTGLGVIVSSLIVAAGLGELSILFTWPSPLEAWTWSFYLGVVLMILGSLLWLRAGYDKRRASVRKSVEVLATVGQLALPFYVVHETIIPLKAIIESIGLPDLLAVAIALGVFSVASWLMIRRVRTLFHSS